LSSLSILTADVTDYVDRTDLGAKIPLLSKLARLFLERKFPLASILAVKDTQFPAGNTFLMPSDTLAVIKVSLLAGNFTTTLVRKTEGFVRLNASVNKYYHRVQNLGYFGHASVPGASIIIDYTKAQVDLINPNDTNEWLLQAYDVFFWATVYQAQLYLKDKAEAEIAKTNLDEVLHNFELAAVAKEHSDLASAPGD